MDNEIINKSAILDISGFLIVEPISFNDLFASALTSGCVSDIALDIELTIYGKHPDNYFGELCAK